MNRLMLKYTLVIIILIFAVVLADTAENVEIATSKADTAVVDTAETASPKADSVVTGIAEIAAPEPDAVVADSVKIAAAEPETAVLDTTEIVVSKADTAVVNTAETAAKADTAIVDTAATAASKADTAEIAAPEPDTVVADSVEIAAAEPDTAKIATAKADTAIVDTAATAAAKADTAIVDTAAIAAKADSVTTDRTAAEHTDESDLDQAAIESLFGVYLPDTAKAPDTVRVLPPFDGNYQILVARPAYALYDDEEDGTEWVSAMAEVYTCYKVGSLPRTRVFLIEEVDHVLPGSRNYGKRLSRQLVIDAAKKLGATHILFQEYQPIGVDYEIRYIMELFWIQEDTAVVRPAGIVAYSDFERGLEALLEEIADAMDPEAKDTYALKMSAMGGDWEIEALGSILAGEGEFTKERAAETYAAAESLISENSKLTAVQYAAALLAGRAGNYPRAVEHINEVIRQSGQYPALQLRQAEYLRGAGRYEEAARAAETVRAYPPLKTPAAMEAAMIHQARGDFTRARAEYNAIIENDLANAIVYFRAAMAAAMAGDTGGCASYVKYAAESGYELSANRYYELGAAFNKHTEHGRTAIKYFKMSLGPTQTDEKIWLDIADTYNRLGEKELEADIYVHLFKSNPGAHSERFKQAGKIYESIGMIDKAREVYTLFLYRGFSGVDVSISLARILVSQKECDRLRDILVPTAENAEIMQLFKSCGYRVGGNPNEWLRATPPATLAMRISGIALAGIGIVGGVIYDGKVKAEAKKYNDFGDPLYPKGTNAEYYGKVQEMRKNIDNAALNRNLLYVMAGAGVGLFGASFYFKF